MDLIFVGSKTKFSWLAVVIGRNSFNVCPFVVTARYWHDNCNDIYLGVSGLAFTQDVMSMTPAALSRKLAELENNMAAHAKNLEFEEAAAVRDQIAELKQIAFMGA